MPAIEGVIIATPTAPPSEAAREWARALLETNVEAQRAWEGQPVGGCSLCHARDVNVFPRHPADPESELLCAQCYRGVTDYRDYPTLCDNDPDHGRAWRNPFTRRNEYFCAACHAKTPEGVVQNRWARVVDGIGVRESAPLGVRKRVECAAKGVAGVKPCQGQVKPRGTEGVSLCDQHAGKLRR
jgi:hypothetical protein